MATDEGLEHRSIARRHIENLRDRMEYLEDCVAEDIDLGERPNHYQKREIEAIRWALPILEAEWDNLARLRRNLARVENRLKAREERGVPDDWRAQPEWEQAG